MNEKLSNAKRRFFSTTQNIKEMPKICHDCRVEEGQIHHLGCDMERCPFCGGQLMGCNCRYTLLGFDYNWNKPQSGLPLDIYNNGLPPELEEKWEKMLNEKGRVPYIFYPNVCARCGELMPDLFSVSNQEWKHYIEISERNQVICRNCFDYIKEVIDDNISGGLPER